MKVMRVEFIKRNIVVDPDTDCWNWNKSTNSSGYGQFTRNKKYWATHRFVYEQNHGQIPAGLVVRHICHNTKCCNPDHLMLGTPKDNWWDSEEKNRESHLKYRKCFIINGVLYESHREASEATKLGSATLVKHTDENTRIFNVEAYREGCGQNGYIPKV